jgi:acyl carrier protein
LPTRSVPDPPTGGTGEAHAVQGGNLEDDEMAESTEDRVRNVVARVLKVDPAGVQAGSRFAADLGAESIQSVELVAAFEEEFDIEMDEDEALSVQTVGDAVTFIAGCLRDQHGEGS